MMTFVHIHDRDDDIYVCRDNGTKNYGCSILQTLLVV